MRVLITADLHWNHPRSRVSAEAIIETMNAVPADVLLIVGDVGVADGDSIETCLSRFTFAGPRLFVPGNHELWSNRRDVDLLGEELPRRVRAIGWQWLPDEPFVGADGGAIVGALGWYDYAFAARDLEISNDFYAVGASPGAVIYTSQPASLVDAAKASPDRARELVARWNDAKFVRLGASDATIVDRECARSRRSSMGLAEARSVLAATHTVPFVELLPAHHGGQWDFARAYLGSPRLGETIARFGNVAHVVCGHSHQRGRAMIGSIRAINVGSGYREKRFVVVEVEGRQKAE
jgi:Icc-related predicted phosphoesterase